MPYKQEKGKKGKSKNLLSDLPTNWKEKITELYLNGRTDKEIRAWLIIELGSFSNDLWYALKAREPEFKEVVDQGKVLAFAWWINFAREKMTSSHFHNATFRLVMANCFNWNTEKYEIAERIAAKKKEIDKMSDDERMSDINEMLNPNADDQ